MIRLATEDFNIEPYFDILTPGDPFGCRIKSLYKVYNYNLSFADFWAQIADNKCTALIARLETSFILRLTDEADMEEISSFLRVSGGLSFLCDGRYSLSGSFTRTEGVILTRDSYMEADEGFNIINPTVKEVYDVISRCRGDDFSVPNYESFALDVSHKLKKGCARVYGIEENTLQACIMTLAESEDCAVFGALATLPESRGRGFGACLVKYLSNVLISEGKMVFLHRAKNNNKEFYNKLGFKEYGIWAEYSIGELK